MRKVLEIGGIVAAAVLIAFGIASIVMASSGRTRSTRPQDGADHGHARHGLQLDRDGRRGAGITASQTRAGEDVQGGGVTFTPSAVTVPGCSVAGEWSPAASSARCFAQYMLIHAMGATSGLVYAQMGRFMAKPDTPFKYTDGEGALRRVPRTDRRQVRPGRRDRPSSRSTTARGTSGSTRSRCRRR